MSLSDRLQQAKTQRLIAAGVLSSAHALKPEAEPDAELHEEPEPAFEPVTIEVMSSGLHAVADEANALSSAADTEHPSNCPKCYTLGQLDMVDLVGHTMHLTCPTCGTMWQVHQPDNASVEL